MKNKYLLTILVLWTCTFLFASCASGHETETEMTLSESQPSSAEDTEEQSEESETSASEIDSEAEEERFQTDDVQDFLTHYQFKQPTGYYWPEEIDFRNMTVQNVRIWDQNDDRVLLLCRDSARFLHWMKLVYEMDEKGNRYLCCTDELVGKAFSGEASCLPEEAYPLLYEFYDARPDVFDCTEEKLKIVKKALWDFLAVFCSMPEITEDQVDRLVYLAPLPLTVRLLMPLRENMEPENIIPFIAVLSEEKYDVGINRETVDQLEFWLFKDDLLKLSCRYLRFSPELGRWYLEWNEITEVTP